MTPEEAAASWAKMMEEIGYDPAPDDSWHFCDGDDEMPPYTPEEARQSRHDWIVDRLTEPQIDWDAFRRGIV